MGWWMAEGTPSFKTGSDIKASKDLWSEGVLFHMAAEAANVFLFFKMSWPWVQVQSQRIITGKSFSSWHETAKWASCHSFEVVKVFPKQLWLTFNWLFGGLVISLDVLTPAHIPHVRTELGLLRFCISTLKHICWLPGQLLTQIRWFPVKIFPNHRRKMRLEF